jgi:hypothetical protein
MPKPARWSKTLPFSDLAALGSADRGAAGRETLVSVVLALAEKRLELPSR